MQVLGTWGRALLGWWWGSKEEGSEIIAKFPPTRIHPSWNWTNRETEKHRLTQSTMSHEEGSREGQAASGAHTSPREGSPHQEERDCGKDLGTSQAAHPPAPPTTRDKQQVVDLRKLDVDQLKCMKPSDVTLNPFANMKIQDSSFLEEIDGRSACHKCSKSRKYFCYTCYVPLPCIADRIPTLQLPFKIDIIRHPREIAGKSTAVHAALVCPGDVRIYTYPALPDYTKEREEVVLIFPEKEAMSVEELARPPHPPSHKRSCPNLPFRKAVFIDCTWNQTRKIYSDERIQGLRCVELNQYETLFWRYQRGKPKTYLATIEAIYYFLVEVHNACLSPGHQGQYDNLLFFFKFMYEKIHAQYDTTCLRAYKDL